MKVYLCHYIYTNINSMETKNLALGGKYLIEIGTPGHGRHDAGSMLPFYIAMQIC